MASRTRVEVEARLKGVRKFLADSYAAAHGVDEIGDAASRADRKIIGLNARADLLRNAIGLTRPAVLATGLTLAAGAAGGLAAGVLGLSAALGPLSGAMVAFPGLGLAAAQGMGAWGLAMNGVLDAVGGLNDGLDPKKLGALSAEGQRFALVLDGMKAPIRGLQTATQAGLFPGLMSALGTVRPLLHTFQSELKGTGEALGGVAQRAAGFAVAAGPDLQTLLGRNSTYLGRMGDAGIHLAGALLNILVPAGPLLGWLTKTAVAWSVWIEKTTAANRATGKTASFFWKTRQVATQLGHIIADLAGAFYDVGKASSPLGGSILDALEKGADALHRWTGSAEGTAKMAAYFTQMKPVIFELGRLARDLVGSFLTLSSSSDLAPLIAQVRTQLLPALTDVIASTSSVFGPTILAAITTAAGLFRAMSANGTPLVLLADGIGALARGLTFLMQNVPGLSSLALALGTIGLASRTLPFALLVTGLRSVVQGAQVATESVKALRAGMGALRAVYIAQTGVTNASTLAVLRHYAAQRLAAAGARVMAVAQGALNLVMAANPIVLAVLALAALAAGFYLAYQKVGWFRDGVDATFSWVKSHWPLLVAILTGPIGIAVLAIVRNWDKIKAGASAAWTYVRDGFSSLGGFLAGIPGRFGSALSGAFNGLRDGFKSAVNWIIGKWNSLHFSIGGTDLGPFGHLPKVNLDTPDLPMLAAGGIVSGGGSWITGEAGPEVNTLDHGRVKVQPLGGASRIPTPSHPAVPDVSGVLSDLSDRIYGPGDSAPFVLELDGDPVYDSMARRDRRRASRA